MRKKKNKRFDISTFILFIVFLYLAYTFVIYLKREKVKIYEVLEGSLIKDTRHTGLILRDEEVYNSNIAGTINYFIKEASYVSVGAKVCAIDSSGSIDKLIREKYIDNPSITGDKLESIRGELSDFLNEYNDLSFDSVYGTKNLIDIEMLDYLDFHLSEEIENRLREENIQYEEIRANKAGLVSFNIDGFENLSIEQIEKDSFKKERKKEKKPDNNKIDENVPIYKLVDNEEFKIVFLIENDELLDKEELKIRFLNKDLKVRGKFEVIENKNGLKLGVISLDKYQVQFLEDRFVDFDIENDDYQGLKIPKKAIFEKEFLKIPLSFVTKGGGLNSYGVLKEVYDEKGTSVVFEDLQIYFVDDEYYYVGLEDEAKIKVGDYIIGENNRYQLLDKASLKGVYNINKAYTLFKHIEIISDNEEYCIVKKDTKYGLKVYDHILLEPQKYKDKDFVYR